MKKKKWIQKENKRKILQVTRIVFVEEEGGRERGKGDGVKE